MALTLRSTKGIALTWSELDANFSGLADGSNWGTIAGPQTFSDAVTLQSTLTVSAGGFSFTHSGTVFKQTDANGVNLNLSGTGYWNDAAGVRFSGLYFPAGTSAVIRANNIDGITLDSSGNTTLAGTLNIGSIGAFAASDKYLVVDASGNIHKSATGPAS